MPISFPAKLSKLSSRKIFEVGFIAKTKPNESKPSKGLSINQTN